MEENKIIILETKDKEASCNFFLDSEKVYLLIHQIAMVVKNLCYQI